MIKSLAYVGISCPDAQEWATFGTEVLGMQLVPRSDEGVVRLRMDDAAYRLAVHPAETRDVRYIGWTITDEIAAESARTQLESAGVTVRTATAEEAAERRVGGYLWFNDPFGFRHELAWGQVVEIGTFQPARPMSGFMTGEQGMGHVVLFVPDIAEADRFFGRVMGFKLSDRVVEYGSDLRFYHVNGRHHSLAVVGTPGVVGLHHLMLETTSLDDVGNALDICHAREIPVVQTIGRHTNDLMTSFYVFTPSHFRIEYGYGGLEVDDLWVPKTFASSSIWGHKRPSEYKHLPRGLVVDRPVTADA
ncbi:VOC family protein [Rhodococcus hoagii]|nr:VOC family protein [Prescottella equi]